MEHIMGKKKLQFLSLTFLLILFISCSQNPYKTPESITTKFLSALTRFDFKEAARYGTEKTARDMEVIEKIMDMIGLEELERFKNASFKILSTSLNMDEAIVKYQINGAAEKMKTVLDNGKWRVDFTYDIDFPQIDQ